MAPRNPRVAKAFRAMKVLGINEEKVKPVLKNLLRLYDKNWAPIEEENYRVLADAIFEEEDANVSVPKGCENADHEENLEESLDHDELEHPLKRMRLRSQGPIGPSNLSSDGPLLKRPKLQGELPVFSSQQPSPDITKLAQPNFDSIRTQSQPLSHQNHTGNMGKQPVSPKPLTVQERLDPYQLCSPERTQPCAVGRPESNSLLSQIRAGNKGKEHESTQVCLTERRNIAERTSHALHIKDPTAIVKPGTVCLPKQKATDALALITPKDEPFTDDIIGENILPVAVLHPESSSKADSSVGNILKGKSVCHEPLALQNVDSENRGDGMERTNCEPDIIPEESSTSLDIASSPMGEVKISISCCSVLGRPNFHMPSLDEIRKSMEEKCLQSYKIFDPSFSFMKLMNDVCECFLELATNSSHESQEGLLNPKATLDLLKKSAQDAIGVGDKMTNVCTPSSASNGSVNIQCSSEVAAPQIPRLLQRDNILDNDNQMSKEIIVNGHAESTKGMEFKDPEFTNSNSLVVVPQCELNLDELRSHHYVNDIAKGEEGLEISWVNEITDECLPSFYYIPLNLVFKSAAVKFPLSRIRNENCCSTCFGDCLSSAGSCACALETGGGFAYTSKGLLKEEVLEERILTSRKKQKYHFCRECPIEKSKKEEMLEACKGHVERKIIKECWRKCGCFKQCGNRVVQRGIIHKLQVFYTPDGKGWGLRTLEKIPKGAFVCEFVGEILTIRELFERRMQTTNSEEHSSPVLLDAFWVLNGGSKDEEALCLDATYFGNVARFINHRCFDANLIDIPVEVETPDHYYYHHAFFTTREVHALEELTWDYGIEFDDPDHPVKAFRCQCGSKFCRNMKRLNRSRPCAAR